MPPALTERVRSAIPHAQLFVMYGQTEASARLTYLPPNRLDEKRGSVGIGIPGVSIRVTLPDGRTAAAGEQGELVASGANVMVGYWRDPEETARVLRDGALHTGDLGWMDDEGFLFIVGRSSDIIKSGAHRIAPQEIEEVIAELDSVAEVAVTGIQNEILGESIAAFIVPAHGVDVDANEILARCVERLPKFKIPSHLVTVSDLPRSSATKVRRRELKTWMAENRGTLLYPRSSARAETSS